MKAAISSFLGAKISGKDRLFIHNIFQFVCILGWFSILSYTDAYYIIYLFIGLIGLLCRSKVIGANKSLSFRSDRLNLVAASSFSLMIVMANYGIYSAISDSILFLLWDRPSNFTSFDRYFAHLPLLLSLVCFPILFFGGTYLAFFILQFLTEQWIPFQFEYCKYKMSARKVFFTVFTVISSFHSLILFLCYYPGVISIDSVDQLTQIVENSISNRHPFYHTLFMYPFIWTGTHLFGDINIGVALYSFFTVLMTSAVFSYALVNLYELHINKKILLVVTLIYTLMPYHILFSFTVWKDIPFSVSVLLLIISFFRYTNKIGKNNKLNLVFMMLSSCGICLFRSNGLIVFILILLAFVFFYRKQYMGVSIAFVSILITSVILTYPVLNSQNISQSDLIEMLAVPVQQISRTIIENDDLTEVQIEKINKIADFQEIPSHYNPKTVDPMKKFIRIKGNRNYLNTHKAEYAMLYFELGISHPYSYFTAWVDQTKGYWNAGYDYWRFGHSCWENNIHLKRTVVSKPLQTVMYGYTESFEFFDLLKPFVSIGLHTWMILLVAYMAYRKKDKTVVFLTVPSLAIIFTMLIGTPVFAEFRYAYALFCCLPFLAVVVFRRNLENVNN